MDFPKLVYADFHKFRLSMGLILFLLGLVAASYFVVNYFALCSLLGFYWAALLLWFGVSVWGFILIVQNWRNWRDNQELIDSNNEWVRRKLKAETLIAEAELKKLKKKT